ncbi:hypothetical protein SPONL_670 [uncultured Candidatus Thioglobus sp.]|nr:hypothetical protein SPONL_670 [uncultured Candidatus Thioglobus sp.]
MDKHFIKKLAIRHFKCFDDFSVDGFQQVNLITGRNNVGKTALMEACFLLSNLEILLKNKKINRDILYFELTKLLLSIQQNREKQDFSIKWIKEESAFCFNDFIIEANNLIQLSLNDSYLTPEDRKHKNHNYWNHGEFDINAFRNTKEYNKFYIKNTLPIFSNYDFVSTCDNSKKLHNLIGDLKINNQIGDVQKILNNLFDFDKIDIIKDDIMLQKCDNYFVKLTELGDGIKHLIHTLVALFSNKNKIIYIDEIENGIHHSKLDELWNMILTTSKKLNIQVFATTHSRECIESYVRVTKKLNEKEVALIRLNKRKDDSIFASVFDFKTLQDAIDQEHEVRG